MNHRITTECPECGLKLVINYWNDPGSYEQPPDWGFDISEKSECDCDNSNNQILNLMTEFFKNQNKLKYQEEQSTRQYENEGEI